MRLKINLFLIVIIVLLVSTIVFYEKNFKNKVDIGEIESKSSKINSIPNARNPVKAYVAFVCTPVRLWDGDGPIWCAEGPKVRLAGIAAREIDESCKLNHPCPDAGGVTARNELAKLLGYTVGRSREGHLLIEGPPLQCISAGSAGHGRTAAWCTSSSGGDLSCALVYAKVALRWERHWKNHECTRESRQQVQ